MTDNEIIKALECCMKTEFISDCAKCEMLAFGCKDTLIENAFDLINRQKAEIERLNIELQSMRNAANSYKKKCETAKSEAINWFADRLKENHCYTDRWGKIIALSTIDDIVKEMKEAEK